MSLTETLTAIVATVRAIIARHASHRDPIHAITPAFWNRCARILRLFARLERRWAAGLPLAPRPRPKPPTAEPRTAEPRRTAPRYRHPDTWGWLLREVQPVAQMWPAFAAFLALPETAALLRAAPQAGRLLRPLCRMFAMRPPDILALPRRQAAPRAAPAPAPRRPRLKLWRGPTIPPHLAPHPKPKPKPKPKPNPKPGRG